MLRGQEVLVLLVSSLVLVVVDSQKLVFLNCPSLGVATDMHKVQYTVRSEVVYDESVEWRVSVDQCCARSVAM